jgi:hypothetical protein
LSQPFGFDGARAERPGAGTASCGHIGAWVRRQSVDLSTWLQSQIPVLTVSLVDEPVHPTHAALDRVLAFLGEQLLHSNEDASS